jgi:phosphoglycerate dehydrogenase-like enzyme
MEKSNLVEVLVTLPFNEQHMNSLREISPRLRLTFQNARRPEDVPNEVWSRCEVLYTDRIMPPPEQVPNLRWLQLHYAGIESLFDMPLLQKKELMITTLSGVAAPQMAEFALTMMLALGHRLPEMAQGQAKGDWPRDRWERFNPVEVRGSTVGIVGYGSIGREVARLVRAVGAAVLATKRDVMHPEDTGYSLPGLGDPGGDLFDRLYPPQALRSMLKECDFVVVTLPLTPETRNLIGAPELAAMKPSAYLILLARGSVVDPAALLSTLQDRRIAGAALDAFVEEPLPASSPFWRLNNVIVTPHMAGVSPHYNERAIQLFGDNLRNYLSGAPLMNRFDPVRGY